MSFFDELGALRYYRRFIEAGGGIGEIRKALGWSTWYAVKWWEELRNRFSSSEAAKGSVLGRALYLSLMARGIIDDEGKVVKRVERPERPTNPYAVEFMELHDSFDALGAAEVAAGRVGREKLRILYSSMLAQGWYNIMRETFLDLVLKGYSSVIEPHCKEGQMAHAAIKRGVEKYFAYDPDPDDVEAAAALLGTRSGSCSDGVCVYHAASICDDAARAAAESFAGRFDAMLVFHTLYWMADPIAELSCARNLLRPGAAVLVGQQVVESTPGLLAIVVSFGAKHVFKWKDVEAVLRAAGYKFERRYVRYTPYYIAVWTAS
jgi:SAM-dependent methyltransferase